MTEMIVRFARKSRKGFTLVELIAVIAILGILAAVLVPTVTGVVGNARKTAEKADVHTAYVAAQEAIEDLENSSAAVDAASVENKARSYASNVVITDIQWDGTDAAHPDKIQTITVTTSNGTSVKYTPAAAGDAAYDGLQ